jgi:hypothetical protein
MLKDIKVKRYNNIGRNITIIISKSLPIVLLETKV